MYHPLRNFDPLKELSYLPSLGAVKPIIESRRRTRTKTTYIDQLSKPYAIFRFRYKPRGELSITPAGLIVSLNFVVELLEDEGIAPPSERPKQSSTGDKRPLPEDADTRPAPKRPATVSACFARTS